MSLTAMWVLNFHLKKSSVLTVHTKYFSNNSCNSWKFHFKSSVCSCSDWLFQISMIKTLIVNCVDISSKSLSHCSVSSGVMKRAMKTLAIMQRATNQNCLCLSENTQVTLIVTIVKDILFVIQVTTSFLLLNPSNLNNKEYAKE